MFLLFQGGIFRFHVCFQGCKWCSFSILNIPVPSHSCFSSWRVLDLLLDIDRHLWPHMKVFGPVGKKRPWEMGFGTQTKENIRSCKRLRVSSDSQWYLQISNDFNWFLMISHVSVYWYASDNRQPVTPNNDSGQNIKSLKRLVIWWKFPWFVPTKAIWLGTTPPPTSSSN